MSKFAPQHYWERTPKIARKVGDSILIFCVGASPLIMTLPISEHDQKWWMFGLSITGVVAKVITNFFKEADE